VFGQAAAVLHAYFAAVGGSVGAQMALGHRYLFGDGVRASCDASLPFYELAANQVRRTG
jgi:SEL1 protein